MKKRTKITALLMAMILVMGSMTACGGDSKDNGSSNNGGSTSTETNAEPVDVTLTVWAPQEEQKDYSAVDEAYGDNLLKYMCESFNDAHPEWNITFEYGVCSEADAKDQVTKDAEAAADVFMYAGDQVASLVNAGVVNPLLGLDEVTANNGEKAMSAVTVDGNVYGVPFTPNTWFMYYDKSKYSEDEVKSLDTMMAKDLGDCKYNFSIDMDNGWYNGGFFYGAGCNITADADDNLTCDFNNEAGLAAAKVMLDLAKAKNFLCQDDANVALAQMAEGNCAAFCSGTWDAAAVKEALGDNYAATKLPEITINGSSVQLNSIGDYKYIGVNPYAENVEAAQALAIYLGSADCQLARFKARNVSPTWAALSEDEEVANDIATSALAAQNQFTAVTPISDNFGNNYWSSMEAFGKGLINGDITDKNLEDQLGKTVKNITTNATK